MSTTTETKLELKTPPSLASAYWHAFVEPREGLKPNLSIPKIQATLNRISAHPTKLARYEKICGFKESTHLPITYPHLLAAPLQLKILTAPEFPLKLLGLVHVRNSITQYRPILKSEPLNVGCSVSGGVFTEKGFEFDLQTHYQIQKKIVWESTSTFLVRHPQSPKETKKQSTAKTLLEQSAEHCAHWLVKENTGRRYACVSGDINPIHLHALTAKLFGFPRAIAHGMWTLARAAAKINVTASSEHPKTTLTASFKLPIYLPSTVLFCYASSQAETASFQVTDKHGEKPHLIGTIRFWR